ADRLFGDQDHCQEENTGAGRAGTVAQGKSTTGARQYPDVQEVAADRGRHGSTGKSARALGDGVRERGFGEFVDQVRQDLRTQLEPLLGIKASCRLSGINRSTYYRHRDPSPKASHKASRTSPPDRKSTRLNSSHV